MLSYRWWWEANRNIYFNKNCCCCSWSVYVECRWVPLSAVEVRWVKNKWFCLGARARFMKEGICCSLLRVRLYTPTDLKSSVGAKIKEMFCLGARTRFMKEGIYFVALAVLGKWYLMTSRWRHHHNIWVRLPATPVSNYGKWHKHLRVCQGNYIQKDSNVGEIYYYILFIVEVKSR